MHFDGDGDADGGADAGRRAWGNKEMAGDMAGTQLAAGMVGPAAYQAPVLEKLGQEWRSQTKKYF